MRKTNKQINKQTPFTQKFTNFKSMKKTPSPKQTLKIPAHLMMCKKTGRFRIFFSNITGITHANN